MAQDSWFYLFVGTYANADKSNGIHVYKFNATGDVEKAGITRETENASFLAVSRDRKNLYAVSELGGGNGGVHAYRFDPATARLTLLNKMPSHGDHPCYVTVDSDKQVVAVGNYSGGNLAAYWLNADGSLKAPAQVIQHEGHGPNTQRQERPHVHATVFSSDEQFLFVPDLGTDKVNIYKRSDSEPLLAATIPFAPLPPGSGPRHITFHPNGKFAFVVNELNATVTAFNYTSGQLTPIETRSMVAEGFEGAVGAADIHVSPDGKFLYASNRGDANDIVIWSVSPSGALTPVATQSTLGQTPRNFAIDPSGNFLLVANQNSNEIVIFRRNVETGLLNDTGKRIAVDRPVCLKFASP